MDAESKERGRDYLAADNGGFSVKTLGYIMIVLLAFAVPVRAAQVYKGCNVPSATFRHTWYIDPVHGKTQAAGGDGSQAHPWNSMKAVAGTKISGIFGPDVGYTQPLLSSVTEGRGGGTGPIQPGDTIELMSGDYGDVTIGDFNSPVTNSDFVVVEAAPGQTPVFDTLTITRTNKWVFNAIKVQSLLGTNGNTQALVTLRDQGPSFPTTDIILENMQISSADSTAGWSKAQWIAQARFGFSAVGSAGNGTNGEPNTSCISLAGSHIQNVRTGAILAANNLMFTNNVVDHFGDDGIDYAANNLAITHNTMHDNLDLADGNHEDAMQGQNGPLPAGVGFNAFSNILIDSNLILRQTDPNNPFPTYLQGIDAFDEDWTNMTITNNVVVTSACSGIAFSSIHNSLIANNTVVDDGAGRAPGCIASVSVGGATHQGPLSSNTVVRNNLASQVDIDNRNIGVEADHNVGMFSTGPALAWYVNGTVQFFSRPGPYMNGNIIDAGGAKSEFLNFNPSTLTYTVILKSGAPAVGAGTAAGAPTVDILGIPRTGSNYTTAGAYAYPY